MPLLEFLALNVYVASLPLMVAFNIGKALKEGGFEDGYEVMDSAAREYIWLKRTEVTFQYYSSEESERKTYTYLKPRVSKALDHGRCFLTAEETQAWCAPMLRIDPAIVRHYLSLMN